MNLKVALLRYVPALLANIRHDTLPGTNTPASSDVNYLRKMFYNIGPKSESLLFVVDTLECLSVARLTLSSVGKARSLPKS
jgi:hypothetical protein